MHAEISHRIKELRSGRTQKQFADELGISLQGYLRYEYGQRMPPGKVLKKLADIGCVTVDWILTGVEKTDTIKESRAEYHDDLTQKILDMLSGMNKDQKRQALRFIEGQKLLAEREKKLKEGA